MPTILIADDHDANRKVLSKLFRHQGYTVIGACDGASALEMMRTDRPDVALVDLLMPVVDGFEFVHRLRLEGGDLARTPVVFITAAYTHEEVLNLARSCGVTQVLARPLPFEEIAQAVQSAIRSAPPSVATPSRGEFSMEHLQLLSKKVTENLWSIIPSLADAVEKEPERSEGQAADPSATEAEPGAPALHQ